MFRIRVISFLRDIWQTKTRFFSIFAIVAIGVGFFSGVKATEPDMRESVNQYYVDHRLTHFILSSPLGFDFADIDNIENGLMEKMHHDADISVAGGFCEDNIVEDPKKGDTALRVMSYSRYFNTLEVVDGVMPKKNNECAVLAYNTKSAYQIGDVISFDDNASLKEKNLTVTAVVICPLYMSKAQFGTTNIGDGSLSGAVFVNETAFNMTYYNRAYIFDKYLADRVSYTDRFDSAYERLETAVSELCDERYAYFRDESKTDYTDLHLNVFSMDMHKSAIKLKKTYDSLIEKQNKIASDADFLQKTQAYFDAHDASVITPEYSWPAYFSAVYKLTEYDQDGLPIADYTCEGLYNLVMKEKYTVDSYLYYKYQRYLLTMINEAQKEKFDTALGKYEKSFDTFKGEFDKATQDITAVWYYASRDSLPAYTEYGSNAERIGNISKIFPVFFLLVAALVCLTTMTRMVDENRTQIGTRKALGFSDWSILNRYLLYAFLASATGSIIGVCIGFKLFPEVIINTYSMLYIMPETVKPFRWDLAIGSILATLVCMLLTVIISCAAELFNTPAKLLRPKAPQKGKKILLERIPFIWKPLTFIQKVTLRNIFRYKKRMIMTVIGIAGCTALVLTAFGLRDSISDIVKLQFDEVVKYNMSARFNHAEEAVTDISRVIAPNNYLMVMQKTGTVATNQGTMEVNMFVPQDRERLNDFITLRSRTTKAEYQLGENDIIISEKLAAKLDIHEGDVVDMYIAEDNIQSFYVYAITENYAYHYAYIPSSLYQQTLGDVEYNTALCRYDGADEQQAAKEMLKNGNVLAVSRQSEIKDNFADILRLLDSVIIVLIVSAGALAFVVLFNLSNININERKREMATLKVLGFNNRQTGSYIIRENIILSVFGTLLGLLFGRILTSFVVQTAEIDLVMFGRTVYAESYLLAAAITLVFAIVVSLLMNIKIKRIDMVESLKSVE